MSKTIYWISDLRKDSKYDGIIPVAGYQKEGRPVEEVAVMEKAKIYHADAVFFEAPKDTGGTIAQAFIYHSDSYIQDNEFAKLHQRLWSWGGVPLVFRFTSGQVQLFRCAHKPDFEKNGQIILKPFKTLALTAKIVNDPWWDIERLRSGNLWDDPDVCKQLLSSEQAAQKTLINAIKELNDDLNKKQILPKSLRRCLLILSILIAYLEARKVFEKDFFDDFLPGAKSFFEVLSDGQALVQLLNHLEKRFNGHVFVLNDEERQKLIASDKQLTRFARFVEGKEEAGGQLTLWMRYSFSDLPVELISHIYQLFVEDASVSVYTPHFLVRLMLGEVLDWKRLDRLEQNNEVILDPACGSGIFLVEAYKRLVLHWRSRNHWKRPNQTVLKKLIKRLRGIDKEEGAVELTAFSLCLALCDALEPEQIRSSVKLFPELKEKTIHTSCFFEFCENKKHKDKVGIIIGNPPFASKLDTESAKFAYEKYQQEQGSLPDRQIAYLFLHQSIELLTPGGVLSMLQQYNFLYNQQSLAFRQRFFERWDVREIFDFISVRGLFKKGSADTKVIVVVAEAQTAPSDRKILHATFRRSGRTVAEQGFDIDYYDMHWIPRELLLSNDRIWRSNLLGGGRVLGFVDRLKQFRTLEEYAKEQGWDYGEGFIEGKRGVSRPASHIIGKPLLPSESIGIEGIDKSMITVVGDKNIEGPRSEKRFFPPMLLVREHMDIYCDTWFSHYLTYKNKVVGVCGSSSDSKLIAELKKWLISEKVTLQAYVAIISLRLFTQKATTLSAVDIFSLPFPENKSLSISAHEKILINDIVEYYRDLIRLGQDSIAMKRTLNPSSPELHEFNTIFTERINAIYKKNPLHPLEAYSWPGVICQPYIFGKGKVDWKNADELKGKLDALLRESRGGGLHITRIARLYDGACIYLLKPDRMRYWLGSIALRDSDEVLADLAEQGF